MTFRPLHIALLPTVVLLLVMPATAQEIATAEAADAAVEPPVVELTAIDYAIELPDELPSGWTTLRFTNEGDDPHHVLFTRLPEGVTFEDYETQIFTAFADVWYALRDEGIGHDEAMAMLVENVPAWTWELEFTGGPGITHPGLSSDVTVFLQPGNYVVECYMKTGDGEIHYMEGMARPLVVTEEITAAAPPAPDARITLSNFEMAIDGDLSAGSATVAVFVAEHPEVGFGHNVHVARVNDDASVDELLEWLNFMNVEGLTPDAPATFVGGTHLLPAGQTTYFTLDFEPGRYVFVSEYTGRQGVLQEVVVKP